MQKSPGGSIFPYYYKNGELFGAHFGSFFGDEERLIKLMKAEAAFFLKQNRSMGYWIDFYETKLSNRVLAELIAFLTALEGRITKLGIVGCSLRDKGRLAKLIKKNSQLASLPVRFYEDPEEAKTWLVSESG